MTENACASFAAVPDPTSAANATLSTCLGAEEAVKHVLNIIEMLFFDLPARLEVITEDCRAGTAHHAQLPAQIREVLHLRGLSLSPLRHLGGTAHGSAKDIA